MLTFPPTECAAFIILTGLRAAHALLQQRWQERGALLPVLTLDLVLSFYNRSLNIAISAVCEWFVLAFKRGALHVMHLGSRFCTIPTD